MPSLGDELLTNARLVDGGAKVILVFVFFVFVFFVFVVLMSISCFAFCSFLSSRQLYGEMGRPSRRS